MTKIDAVDLFCGVGGLTHGLIRGGVNVVAGVDIDEYCRYPYEANNGAPFIERDVQKLTAGDLRKYYRKGHISLLAGCAPCQPFSTYSQSGRNGEYEQQWPLVSRFGKLVRDLQPDLVTMENVPQLSNHEVFGQFLLNFRGYHIWWSVVECERYGVPQTRRRLVFLASKFGDEGLSLPKPSARSKTVRQTIAKLPAIAAGEQHKRDRLHYAPSLSPLNMKRIRASRPGGTWRDWPTSLQASCHKKQSGETYPSVYGRMEWDAAAPTMTTQCFGYGNGRFGHPEQDRAISLREAAMLQTFPADYDFVPDGEKVKFNRLGRLIGNAVPVRLGEVIAESLLSHVNRYT